MPFLKPRASVAADALSLKNFTVCAQVEFVHHLTRLSFRKQPLHANIFFLTYVKLVFLSFKVYFLFLNLTDKMFTSRKLTSVPQSSHISHMLSPDKTQNRLYFFLATVFKYGSIFSLYCITLLATVFNQNMQIQKGMSKCS